MAEFAAGIYDRPIRGNDCDRLWNAYLASVGRQPAYRPRSIIIEKTGQQFMNSKTHRGQHAARQQESK